MLVNIARLAMRPTVLKPFSPDATVMVRFYQVLRTFCVVQELTESLQGPICNMLYLPSDILP